MTSLTTLTASTPDLPCRTTDPDLWFSRSSTDRALAVALCQECPVRTACAQYALNDRSLTGVWGGTTAADRRGFRDGRPWRFDEQGRIRLVCGSEAAYRAHFGYREQPCDRCLLAHEARMTVDRRARLEAEHAAGGSSKGFWIHRSLSEPPCSDCREAYLTQQAINRQARARRRSQRPRTAHTALGPTDVLNGPQAGAQSLALAG
ncbi:WhiB family transcriptional regulator [Streptomyces antibioticus]|uniref:WhiB family transcriptional regulator n=1 Tax=Streptomyces antibioticus TaxID=1890 RepID=UPI0033B1BD91